MAFVLYRFLGIFYSQKGTSRVIELCGYAGYTMVISLTAFFDTTPLIYMLLSLICTFLLTLLYRGTLLKRLLSTAITYIIMAATEDIIVFFSGYYNVSLFVPIKYESSIGITVISICTFALVLILENLKDLKKGREIPFSYWLAIVFVPVATIYIFLFTSMLFNQSNENHLWLILLNNIIILLINLLVFYMYSKISKLVTVEGEKNLISQQNKYFEAQLFLMQDSQELTKSIRHDMRNHLTSIKSLIESKKYQEADNYIESTIGQLQKKAEISQTGNFLLDSLINYKLYNIKKWNIQLQYTPVIPKDLPIDGFDLTAILGNLLDNALEALEKINGKEKKLTINLSYEKGCFLIKIQNSCNGDLQIEDGLPVTQKSNSHYHGIGLKNVQALVSKYHGSLDISCNNGIFSVAIMLYL